MPPLLQNLHFLTNKSKKDILMIKGQSHEMIWIILKLEQDILMLSIMS